MGKETPRQASASIVYLKKNNSKVNKRTASTIANYEEGFTYTDPATGESDTIKIDLANVDLRWSNKWMPKKGDKLTAKIKLKSWNTAGKDKSFSCGKFTLDDLSFSGPFLVCTIGAVSVPDGNAFRCTARSKTWKNITLKQLASGIVKKYHLKLYYDAGTIKIGTLEQSNETDCSFLNKICQDYGVAIKVYCGKVIIYDKGKYEEKKAAITINKSDIQSWSYNSTITGTYTGATIKYTKGDDNKELTCKVGGGKRILSINEKVDSLADARLKALAKLNTENEKTVTMSMTVMANTKITASRTVRIAGLYRISGKYFVDKVTHKIEAGGAYTMDLELHKCQRRIKA